MNPQNVDKLNDDVRKLYEYLRTQTFELFTSEECDNDDDTPYNFPYAFYVSKHGFYIQGNIMSIDKGTCKVFMTGEDWGEVEELDLGNVPVDSAIELAQIITDETEPRFMCNNCGGGFTRGEIKTDEDGDDYCTSCK
jgi:hypothetical protein